MSKDKARLSSVDGLGDEGRVFDPVREWNNHDENERNEKRWEDLFLLEGEGDVGRDTDCERREKLKIRDSGDAVWGTLSGDMLVAAKENAVVEWLSIALKPDVKNSE